MPKSKEASLDELMETRRDKMTMNEESYSEINRNKLENRLDIVDNDWRATEFKEKLADESGASIEEISECAKEFAKLESYDMSKSTKFKHSTLWYKHVQKKRKNGKLFNRYVERGYFDRKKLKKAAKKYLERAKLTSTTVTEDKEYKNSKILAKKIDQFCEDQVSSFEALTKGSQASVEKDILTQYYEKNKEGYIDEYKEFMTQHSEGTSLYEVRLGKFVNGKIFAGNNAGEYLEQEEKKVPASTNEIVMKGLKPVYYNQKGEMVGDKYVKKPFNSPSNEANMKYNAEFVRLMTSKDPEDQISVARSIMNEIVEQKKLVERDDTFSLEMSEVQEIVRLVECYNALSKIPALNRFINHSNEKEVDEGLALIEKCKKFVRRHEMAWKIRLLSSESKSYFDLNEVK